MKVGVIGCGGMGTTHYLSLKVLSSQMDVVVVALADCREEFLQKAAAEFPEGRFSQWRQDSGRILRRSAFRGS